MTDLRRGNYQEILNPPSDVTAIVNAAIRNGALPEPYQNWDRKGRGHGLAMDIYGFAPVDSPRYVLVQVRRSYRRAKSHWLSVTKEYFVTDGQVALPVSAAARRAVGESEDPSYPLLHIRQSLPAAWRRALSPASVILATDKKTKKAESSGTDDDAAPQPIESELSPAEALTRFVLLASYLEKAHKKSDEVRAAIAEVAEAHLVHACQLFSFSDIPGRATLYALVRALADHSPWAEGARATAMNVLSSLLAIAQGDDRALANLPDAMSDDVQSILRWLIEWRFKDAGVAGEGAAIPEEVRRLLFDRFEMPLASPKPYWMSSSQIEEDLERAIKALLGLDDAQLLALAARSDGRRLVFGDHDPRHIKAALERMEDALCARPLARCAIGFNLIKAGLYPRLTDIAAAVKAAERLPNPRDRWAILQRAGESVAAHLTDKSSETSKAELLSGKLPPSDVIALVGAALPFIDPKKRQAVLSDLSDAAADSSIAAAIAECARLVAEESLPQPVLKEMAMGDGVVAKLATVKLLRDYPELFADEALVSRLEFPYFLMLDPEVGFDRAPKQLFDACTRWLSESTLPAFMNWIKPSRNKIIEHVIGGIGEGLSPEQRGVAFALACFSRDIIGSDRAALNLVRDLNAAQMSKLGEFASASLVSAPSEWSPAEYAVVILDKFAELAAQKGSNARVFFPANKPCSILPYHIPHGMVIRYGRGAEFSEAFVKFAERLKGLVSPEHGEDLARFLVEWYPDPKGFPPYRASLFITHLSPSVRRAFLLALPPRWQVALGLLSNGEVYRGLTRAEINQIAGQLDDSLRAVFCSLDGVRAKMGTPALAPFDFYSRAGDLRDYIADFQPSALRSKLALDLWLFTRRSDLAKAPLPKDESLGDMVAMFAEWHEAIRRGHLSATMRPIQPARIPDRRPEAAVRRM